MIGFWFLFDARRIRFSINFSLLNSTMELRSNRKEPERLSDHLCVEFRNQLIIVGRVQAGGCLVVVEVWV